MKLEKGNKATDWTPAPEDVNSNIDDVKNSLNSFQNTVNTTFKDGVVEQAEAKAIAQHLKTLDAEKADIDKEYSAIYSNANLTGSAKTNLASAKTSFDSAHASLKSTINTVISDGRVSSSESASVTSTFSTYNTQLGVYKQRVQEALDAISSGKVNSMQVGGRNYIKDYQFKRNDVWKRNRTSESFIDTAKGYGYLTASTANPWLYQIMPFDVFKQGQKITIQYEIKCEGVSKNTATDSMLIRTQLSGYENDSGGFIKDVCILGQHENEAGSLTNWTKKTITGTIGDIGAAKSIWFRLYARNFKGKIYFRNVKLELGNKATDLSPAPEDMDFVAQNAVNAQTQASIFNKLTNNGATQGIYLNNGKIYINGEYIKANSITADRITSGTFKGTNFVAGGSSNNGYVEVLDSSNKLIFKAQKGGVVSRKITFVNDVNSGFGSSTPIVTSIDQEGVNMACRTGVSSDGFSTSYDKETRYSSEEVRMSYSKRSQNDATGSTTYYKEEGMSLTPKTVTFEVLADDGSGTITTGLFKKSAMARGTANTYQAGISVGYWDSLVIGSNLGSMEDGALGRGTGADIFAEIGGGYATFNGTIASGAITASGESRFHNGNYSDPWHGQPCAIKATGHIASTATIKGAHLQATGNGKNLLLGTGDSDVYIHNSASGKYLQLKDDGTLSYDDKLIYHDGNSKGPTQGNWFSGGFPRVGTNGVMEIGKYIDFHNSNSTTADYDNRITSNGDTLEFSGNIKAAGSIYVRESRVATQASHGGLDIGNTDRNTAICSANAPIWWNGSSSFVIYTSGSKPTPADIGALGNSGTQTIHVAQGKFNIIGNGNRGHIDVQGGFHTRGDSNDIWFERSVMPASWNNAGLFLGYSDKRWKALYASNGTIQTSDERFKVKQGFTDIEECYEMIKDTDIYNYIMLSQNKEDLSKNRLGKLALSSSQEQVNIHMGIMAQDIQKYKCSKQILVEGEYERADGSRDTMLSVNPYGLTTAIMGALKVEIQKRELLEEKITKLESLVEQLMTQSVK